MAWCHRPDVGVKMKAVLIDIDGVICDFMGAWRKAAFSVLGIDLGTKVPPTWNLKDAYGLTHAQENSVWNSEQLIQEMQRATVISRGLELIHEYQDTPGVEIHYVTQRSSRNENERSMRIRAITKQWLLDAGIQVDGNVHHMNDKLAMLHVLGLNAFDVHAYEDSPGNVQAYLEAGILTFMPVYAYNEHLLEEHGDNVQLVPLQDWT